MSIARFYNRVGYVVLREGNKEYDEFRGLNFKFSCEYCHSPGEGVRAQASVGILGLTADRVFQWASFCNNTNQSRYDGLMGSKARSVAVYAGYESSFTGNPLFVLPVVGAWPTSPPEMWLNISAYTTKEFNSHVFSIEMHAPLEMPRRPFTFKQVCQKIADTIRARLDFNAYNESLLGVYYDVSLVGTASDILHWLNNNACAYAEVRIGDPDSETPEMVVYQLDPRGAADMKDNAERLYGGGVVKTPPTISATSGMIGLPKLTVGNGRAGQIEVTTLLRNDISPGDNFKVKSEYVRYANDTFTANKIKHEGEFRGNQWQTTITGIAPSAYQKNKEKESAEKGKSNG